MRRSSRQSPRPEFSNAELQQTPAQDRFYDGIISTPATIVPKLFGEKPFWVPHAFFNLCPFVRGPDIDPVWSAGCAMLPYPQMNEFGFPQNPMQAMIAAQMLQQQGGVAQPPEEEEEEEESWLDQYRPQGPIDFGMAGMYGSIQQTNMYGGEAPGEKRRVSGNGESSSGGFSDLLFSVFG